MHTIKKIFILIVIGLLVVGLSTPVMAKNKFQKEFGKEQVAVKLVREVQRCGYNRRTQAMDRLGQGHADHRHHAL